MRLNAKNAAYAISAVGLAISIYLVILHYTALVPACPETGVINCENVLTSSYAEIFGIPVADMGLIFFIMEFAAVRVYFGKDPLIMLNIVGFAFLFYFWFAEYTLRSICIYCTGVHICVILLLILSIKGFKK